MAHPSLRHLVEEVRRLTPEERGHYFTLRCTAAERELIEKRLASDEATEVLSRSSGASDPELPTPSRLGAYQLGALLGQGGGGAVHRATHVETGEEVALKTVRSARPDLLGSIRREIDALARTQHPGIVRIVAHGVEGGIPWYAMEFLRGTSLRRLLGGAPTADEPVLEETGSPDRPTVPIDMAQGLTPAAPRPVSPPELQRRLLLASRLCQPLAYLHGLGIVHRDLKPDNVLVAAGDHPVIVDFGLMARFASAEGRDSLEVTGDISGTAPYMAPEQAAGLMVDARADLYALGCILYEMVVGHPPFSGETALQILVRHRHDDPVPPSELVEGVPAEVEAIVMRLLAKKPRRRFGFAVDVARALQAAGPAASDVTPSPPAPEPSPYLYRPRLAGRSDQRQRFEACLRRLTDGTGGALLVRGESGAGKTRLALEFSALAFRSGARVLAGRCQPGGQPLQPLIEPLQQVVDDLRAGPSPDLDPAILRLLSPFQPLFASLPGVADQEPPPRLPPGAARARLLASLSTVLLGSSRPSVLFLDDLHWADALSLAFLQHHRRAGFEERGLLVVATARSDAAADVDPSSSFEEILELDALSPPDIERIVADMLAMESPPTHLTRFVAEQSDGNPYFVSEHLRVMVHEEILSRDEQGHWRIEADTAGRLEALPLPRGVRDLLATRIGSLPPLARDALGQAAVLGREWEVATLEAVSPMPANELGGALSVLVREAILQEDEPGRFTFENDRLREVAYHALEDEDRRQTHRAAAEFLDRGSESWPQRGAELGDHWEAAGRPERARPCLLAAAKRAEVDYALPDAARLYRHVIRLSDDDSPEILGALYRLGGKVLPRLGHHREARSLLERALPLARSRGDATAIRVSLCGLADLCSLEGRNDQSESYYREALADAKRRGSLESEGSILGNFGVLLQQWGRLEEGRQAFEEALAIARKIGNRQSEGAQLGNLACVASQQNRLDDAQALFEASVSVQSVIDDRTNLGRNLNNLGGIHAQKGRLDEARSLFERALAIHRSVSNRPDEAAALGSLASWHHRKGDLSPARELFERALAIHRETGNLMMEGITRTNIGKVEAEEGRDAEAEHDLRCGLDLIQKTQARQFEASLRADLALFLQSRQRHEEARAAYEECLPLYREVENHAFTGWILVQLAALARRTRDLPSAAARLDEATPLLEASAEPSLLLGLRIERARQAMANGDDPLPWVRETEETLPLVNQDREALRDVRNLRLTWEAYDEGRDLPLGELPEAPPPAPLNPDEA